MLVAENLKSILNWCSFLGLCPIYNVKTQTFKSHKFYTYAIIALLLFIFMQSFVSYTIYGASQKVSAKTFDALTGVGGATINILTIFAQTSWNLKNVQALFDTFNKVDARFSSVHNVKIAEVAFVTGKFAVQQLILLALIFYYYYGLLIVKSHYYYCSEAVELYFSLNGVLLQFYILLCIKRRVTAMSEALDDMSVLCYQKLSSLNILLCDVMDLVDIFNGLYGLHMAFTIMTTFIYILNNVDYLILDSPAITFTEITKTFNLTFYLFFLELAVITVGEYIAKDSIRFIGKTAKILCVNLDVDFLKEKITFLCQQAKARKAEISAAGFFKVNFVLLFSILHLLTTYVIIIIQFIPK